MPIKIKNKNVLIGWLMLVIIALVTSFLGIYISKSLNGSQESQEINKLQEEIINKTNDLEKKSENIEKLIKPKPSEFPDYYNIKEDNPNKNIKHLLITKDCPDGGCINNKSAIEEFDGIKKNFKIEGGFLRAYLYIEAMVDYNRPLSIWDDVYFNIYHLGGHLILDNNLLPTPPGDSSVYLYDMRSVSYYPKIEDKELGTNRLNNQNLFSVLKNGKTVTIHVSLSSDRPGRVLKEVSIYYECETNSDCSITLAD